ncbi:hypothetical protein R9X47_24450 [Wukongibacter baidiensis]|uniref:hypothetical protein n=1 Tax=Wukongibacter baidiensis TaxID=1723361 RepID=UPI003D7F889A
MEKKKLDNLSLTYDFKYRDSAEIVNDIYKNVEDLIYETWGLNVPSKYKIFVVDSYTYFVFAAAPWYLKIAFGLVFPLWYFSARKVWKFAGGITLLKVKYSPIVIKPMELLTKADTSIGDKIFIRDKDLRKKLQHIICHEIVHVFSSKLKLPMWLNEGIAMVTVDKLLGEQTVRNDTTQMFSDNQYKKLTYKKLSKADKNTIAYNYVYGYWAVMYLEKEHPGFLKELFKKGKVDFEKEIAKKLGIDKKKLWNEFRDLMLNYFIDKTYE